MIIECLSVQCDSNQTQVVRVHITAITLRVVLERRAASLKELYVIPLLSKGLKVAMKIPMRKSLRRYETPSNCPKGSRQTVPILHECYG